MLPGMWELGSRLRFLAKRFSIARFNYCPRQQSLIQSPYLPRHLIPSLDAILDRVI